MNARITSLGWRISTLTVTPGRKRKGVDHYASLVRHFREAHVTSWAACAICRGLDGLN